MRRMIGDCVRVKRSKKVKAGFAGLSWKMCSFPTARWPSAKPLIPLVRWRCRLEQALHACGCVGGPWRPATAYVARCILNPLRVKPDGRTPQMPPPFSHRPLHGCSCGGFLRLRVQSEPFRAGSRARPRRGVSPRPRKGVASGTNSPRGRVWRVGGYKEE